MLSVTDLSQSDYRGSTEALKRAQMEIRAPTLGEVKSSIRVRVLCVK
jgi:hypothetical protein